MSYFDGPVRSPRPHLAEHPELHPATRFGQPPIAIRAIMPGRAARCSRRLPCTLDLVSDQRVPAAEPVSVLREAIDAAVPLVDDAPDAVLGAFARTVSSVMDELAALAAAEPDGSVAAALTQLRRAFNHQGTGAISPACRWQLQRARIALDRQSQH